MRHWILAFALAASACSVAPDAENEVESPDAATPPPNILIMIADDLGVETLSCYGVGQDTAMTPNLDRLCAQSVRFTSAWSQPICTPTRTGILTGRPMAFEQDRKPRADQSFVPKILTGRQKP